jgi:hypothetical protein
MLLRVPVSAGFVDTAAGRRAAGYRVRRRDAGRARPRADAGRRRVPWSTRSPRDRRRGSRLGAGGGNPHPCRAAHLAAAAALRGGTPGDHRAAVLLHRLPDRRRIRRLSGTDRQVAGIQQCCQHVIIRRCRAVSRLGPSGLQSLATDVIAVLRDAHQTAKDARSRAEPISIDLLKDLRERYDEAMRTRIIHNLLRTGTAGISPATCLAAGRATTPPRPTWSGRATPPIGQSKDRNDARPSPDTGTPSRPSAAGAASAATTTPPRTTGAPRSTPSPAPWPETPGCRPQRSRSGLSLTHPANPREWTRLLG